jgi:hypothetical protein
MSNILEPKPSRGANPNPRAGPSHPLSRHLINLAMPLGECHVRKQSRFNWCRFCGRSTAQLRPENMKTCQVKTSSRKSWSRLTKANFDASRACTANPAALPSQSKHPFHSATRYDFSRDPALTVKAGQTWSNLVKPPKTNPLPAVTAQNHRFSPSRLPWMASNRCRLLQTRYTHSAPSNLPFVAVGCG